ncbi:MAG: penicillin-binding protein 2 [Candidatus Paceibacterota bacterium]|jgi:cell division protein FtsI (penicillin-binding protein 3)/stage V sporulation protein D (sporulation-specific penicillin-binding protein)
MREWRINFVLALIFMLAAVIVGRLVFLQIVEHDFYAALASGQQKYFMNSTGERGEVFLQGHELPIATQKASYFLYLSPEEVFPDDRDAVASSLSEITDLEESFILEKLKKASLYELMAERIDEGLRRQIEEAELSGVHIGTENVRSYPYEDFLSHVLGFVNKDGEGQYGVEQYWNDVLTGKEEYLEGEKGPLGFLFSYNKKNSNGADLALNIDYNIQYLAEKLLNNAADQLNIEGGTIIVMDPWTGAVMALAEYPGFDPNSYSSLSDMSVFQSGAAQKVFEPGSVFKPITMAAAINEGAITPQTTYYDPGVINIGGWPIYNYDQRVYPGEITMTGVLEKSINTGAVFAEQQLGNEKFSEYIERFGIFEETGIDIGGEVTPKNTEFQKGYEINFATASFGQGIEMTPIQLVRAFSAIANGGKLVEPHIVKEIKSSDNEAIEVEPKVEEGGVISFNTAQKLTAMLVSVVENGFGKAARIPGYYVAGKTGTAQVSLSAIGGEGSGYSDKTWQSFIGFAPAFNPRFLVLVKLDNPATKTAEYSAVPIFQELAKYIIDYYNIPPDYSD